MKKRIALLSITVVALTTKAATVSPYITSVFEYVPAPGQFINDVPQIGNDPSIVISCVEEELCGATNNGMVSLGAFGGYIIVGFDHPIVNVAGQRDFKIYGNAFTNSAEPGIISVSCDTNHNGLPDDPWYEIHGSAHALPGVMQNYSITYFRPLPDAPKDPDPDIAAVTDRKYIRWEDSTGASGYLQANSSHTQSYWPEWLQNDDKLTFTATRLPGNATDKGGRGNNWVLSPFDYGYADNLPNNSENGIDIAWAYDDEGNPTNLESIDFIKVHTALNQQCTWLGETSTEISGIEDLHPQASASDNGILPDNLNFYREGNTLNIYSPCRQPAFIHDITGKLISIFELAPGKNLHTSPKSPSILRVGTTAYKIF